MSGPNDATIKLTGFLGEQPRIIPRLMKQTAAKSAVDCRLDDGGLTPYRLPSTVTTVAPGNYQTIYDFDGTWLAFTGIVCFARGPIADDRLYYTGDGVPKMRVGSTVYNLKLPAPLDALTVGQAGVGTGDVISQAYVSTYVTSLGEESAPSAPTADVNWQSGITNTISGFAAIPAGRGITKQRIYRTQTGPNGTDYYFIAERAASTSNFVDTVPIDGFAEVLPSKDYDTPPDTLDGLTPMPNGMIAGFVGKQLYLCEPFQPHAWPEKYILNVDFNIVGLVALGNTLMVLTAGIPYAVVGTTPDGLAMEKIQANLPCINRLGIVDLGFAAVWPSNDGLAAFDAVNGPRIVSGSIFTPKDWRALIPGTMVASQINGRWIGSYSATDSSGAPISGSLIIDTETADGFLIRTAVRAKAWFYDHTESELFFLDPTDGVTIKQFDPDAGDPATLYWRSKEFILPDAVNFGAILVDIGPAANASDIAARAAAIAAVEASNAALIAAGSIGGEIGGSYIGRVAFADDILGMVPSLIGSSATVGVFADGVRVAAVTNLGDIVRLPSGFKARKWEVEVNSDIQVQQIVLATNVPALKAVA